MPGPLILQEEQRNKLDGIVQQMIANKEPDENVQWVVNDFKNKYGTPGPAQPPLPYGLQPNRSFMESVANRPIGESVAGRGTMEQQIPEGVVDIAGGHPFRGAARIVTPFALALPGAGIAETPELAAAARQGALEARATKPLWSAKDLIREIPGVEAIAHFIGLPPGASSAAAGAIDLAPKALAFGHGAGRYMTQEPFGPEFQPTPPPGPLRGPLWGGPQPESPAGPGPVEPITPITPIRGKQTTIDLQPSARTPGWSDMPAPEPTALPEVSPIRPTSARRTPPSAVPPPIKPAGSPQAAPPAAAAPVSTPAPPAAPAPVPAAAGGITPIDVPFGEPTVVPPEALPSQDWRFEDARDMARLLNQHGIDPRTMGPDEWKIAAPALKRNLGVPNDRAAQLVRQEWNKLQPRGQ